MAPQCGAVSAKFLQWHPSVGLFQLSFSNGVPVYPGSIRWVAQRYPSVHWVNQWHSSSIPVYTGPASVHWLRVSEVLIVLDTEQAKVMGKPSRYAINFADGNTQTAALIRDQPRFHFMLFVINVASETIVIYSVIKQAYSCKYHT